MRSLASLVSLLSGSYRHPRGTDEEARGTEMEIDEFTEFSQFLHHVSYFNLRDSRYIRWYMSFLSHGAFELMGRLRLVGDEDIAPVHFQKRMFESMSYVLKLLRDEKNVPLAQIHDVLSAQPLLSGASLSEEQRLSVITFLLALITMLFEPSRDFLQRSLSFSGLRPNGGLVPGANSAGPARNYQSIATKPFKDVLRNQSRSHIPIYPRPQQQLSHVPSTVLTNSVETSSLRAPNFYLSNLTNFARITIEWSSCMTRHLDFDATTKTLYLFRYPSFCALVCEHTQRALFWGEGGRTFHLDRFLADYLSQDDRHSQGGATSTLSRPPQHVAGTTAALCTEILASYRLIFGQHRRSQHLAARNISFDNLGANLADADGVIDPLLRTLCTRDWTRTPTVSFMGPVKTGYSPNYDFPMFSARLLALQDFVETQEPGGLTMLWHDRRDAMRFWTLWAVIGFGVIAIFLGIVQVVVGIIQAVAQIKQG